MRADRLLSLLMLLQTHGRMTCQDLAEELEVSERTIYRDLTALSASGVPVYAERGPGGGVALVEEYRTTLTGLTPDEARALFMLGIPAPLKQLGLGQELKAAMLKLSAALPASQRSEQARARQRIHLDSSWWFQFENAVPHLAEIQQALWSDRKLRLIYRSDFSNFDTEVERIVAPYGLVAKANLWHLAYGWEDVIRVVRVSQITEVETLAETFLRPEGFDLAGFWEKWCTEYETGRPSYPVRVRASPELLPHLSHYFGNAAELLAQASPPDTEGWVIMTLPFENFFSARGHLLGFGRAVEVLEPEPLRKSVIDYAGQIVGFYQEREKTGS